MSNKLSSNNLITFLEDSLKKSKNEEEVKGSYLELYVHKYLFFIYGILNNNQKWHPDWPKFDFEAWTYGPVIPKYRYKELEIKKYILSDNDLKKEIGLIIKNLNNHNIWEIIDYTHSFWNWIINSTKSGFKIKDVELKREFNDRKEEIRTWLKSFS